MDLDTLIRRLEDRANGGLATQSPADDCREAAKWLRTLKKSVAAAKTSAEIWLWQTEARQAELLERRAGK